MAKLTASRSLLATRSKKAQRKTKSEVYLVNVKYMGEEPTYEEGHEVTALELAKSLNWYNTMAEPDDAREYIATYLTALEREEELELFHKVPDKRVPCSAAWVARIACMGAVLSDDSLNFFDKKLEEALAHAEESEDDPVDRPAVPVRNKAQERIDGVIADLEELCDQCVAALVAGDDVEFSLYDHLQSIEATPNTALAISRYYAEIVAEYEDVLKGDDPQLNEGYKYMNKAAKKAVYDFYFSLVEDASTFLVNNKKQRKARTPKPISKEKLLKNFTYQEAFNDMKLQSIDPQRIIGAQELWTFNTKYKLLTCFKAADSSGLQVHRSSITNYDEATSVSKRCGRKAEAIVAKVLNSGKVPLRKVMTDITGEPIELLKRSNENTILLRIVN